MAQRILLAGGGTAGHIEPALAVADEIKKSHPNITCEFLGTDGALETLLVPKRGYRLHRIRKVVMPRKLTPGTTLFPMRLALAFVQCIRALKGADILIGFGGYVSAPAYLAALTRRIPVVIHEANAKPGWANRLGRHIARVTAVNFESVRRQWPGAVLTGMPIRHSLSSLNSLGDAEGFRELHCKTWGFDPAKPVVAVFGGSQGSLHINQVIAEFLKKNPNLQIIHAVGINNPLPEVRTGYLPLPYFHDMAAIYGAADLLVTRSGAVTCSELASLGKYAILVPLPHGNGEQIDNAQALVDEGAALMVLNDEFTAEWLSQNIQQAIENARHFTPAHRGSNDQAAARIAQLAINLLADGSTGGTRK